MRIDRFYSKSHNLAIVSSSLVLMNQIWARLYQHQTVARLQICHSKQSDFILKAHLNHIQITYAVHQGLSAVRYSVVTLAHTGCSLRFSFYLFHFVNDSFLIELCSRFWAFSSLACSLSDIAAQPPDFLFTLLSFVRLQIFSKQITQISFALKSVNNVILMTLALVLYMNLIV